MMERHYHVTISDTGVSVFRIADNGEYLPDTLDAIERDICIQSRGAAPLGKVSPSNAQPHHLTGGGGTFIAAALVFVLVLAAAIWWGPDFYGNGLTSWEHLPFSPPDYPG